MKKPLTSPTVISDAITDSAGDVSDVDVVVIGGGACGLVAALRAAKTGASVALLERDSSPSGSTAMSSGFVPAPSTRFQHAIGVTGDSPTRFEADITEKSKGKSESSLVTLAAQTIGPALEWLADEHQIEWIVLDDFLYPSHSFHRMHTVPEKSGEGLMSRLLNAAAATEIALLTNSRVTQLHRRDTNAITAVSIVRPDRTTETIRTNAVVLACNGFGGNPELVAKYIPEIADGLYYGHSGNTGDAVLWGQQLNAWIKHLSGYQGHGSLAHPHGILVSWALMMEGGIQVNLRGERFSNEHSGYSEQAVVVLAQPEQTAWNIFDERIHQFAQTFPDYVEAMNAGAIVRAETIDALATKIGVPSASLGGTLSGINQLHQCDELDSFGRRFSPKPLLQSPYYAVRVTGALFHTQGGLMINERAQVLDSERQAFPNLFAGGGAACGVSGPDVSGYLSGNGLLTAIGFGYIAGDEAGRLTI